jgi:hypothetical protein
MKQSTNCKRSSEIANFELYTNVLSQALPGIQEVT